MSMRFEDVWLNKPNKPQQDCSPAEVGWKQVPNLPTILLMRDIITYIRQAYTDWTARQYEGLLLVWQLWVFRVAWVRRSLLQCASVWRELFPGFLSARRSERFLVATAPTHTHTTHNIHVLSLKLLRVMWNMPRRLKSDSQNTAEQRWRVEW